jgi:hypothetical protein
MRAGEPCDRVHYDARWQGGFRMRIKGQADIEVFISDGGYICLKQKDDVDGERVIEFAPAYGPKVAGAISTLQEFAQAKFEKAIAEE